MDIFEFHDPDWEHGDEECVKEYRNTSTGEAGIISVGKDRNSDGFCIVLEPFVGEPPLNEKILETFDSPSSARIAFQRMREGQ